MLVVLPCSINLRGAAGHQHRLHVALGLREVEELPAVGVAAHLDEPLGLVVADVGERAGGDVQVRIAARGRQPATTAVGQLSGAVSGSSLSIGS